MKSWSLRRKLLLSFLTVAVLVGAVGLIGVLNIRHVATVLNEIVTVNIPATSITQDMRSAAADLSTKVTQLGLPALRSEHPRILQEAAAAFAGYEELKKKYTARPFTSTEAETLFKQADSAWGTLQETLLEMAEKSREGTEKADAEFLKIYSTQFVGKVSDYLKKIDALTTYEKEAISAKGKVGQEVSIRAVVMFTSLTGFGFVLSLLMGLFTANRLSNSLSSIVNRVSQGSEQVAKACAQITQYSGEFSDSSSKQASAIQETAASADEVTAMVRQTAENASQSQRVSTESRQSAEAGQAAVFEMMTAIRDIAQSNEEIRTQVEQSNKDISDIVKVIAEIGSKTKVINDIVFQTKLLSFNASVEAARAGEHGKGFAVVAEEVGNLAQMSGNAAKEISGLLEKSIQNVESIVTNTRQRVEGLITNGNRKVEGGQVVAEKCNASLADILNKVQQLDKMIVDISTSSGEQTVGIEEINKAMTSLDQTTAQNATIALQAADASQFLAQQSESLTQLVGELNQLLLGHGQTMPAGAPVRAASPAPPPAKTRPAAAAPAKKSNVVKLPIAQSPTESQSFGKMRVNGVPDANDPGFQDV